MTPVLRWRMQEKYQTKAEEGVHARQRSLDRLLLPLLPTQKCSCPICMQISAFQIIDFTGSTDMLTAAKPKITGIVDTSHMCLQLRPKHRSRAHRWHEGSRRAVVPPALSQSAGGP